MKTMRRRIRRAVHIATARRTIGAAVGPSGCVASQPGRSTRDQPANRGEALVFLPQRGDLFLELAEQARDVVEGGQRAIQHRTGHAAAAGAAPTAWGQLGAAPPCDAVVVGGYGALLATGLRREPAERFGAADLLGRHQLLNLL